MRIDLHNHTDASDEKLDRILVALDRIHRLQEALMTKADEIGQVITDMDAATNAVAAEIQALRDQIAGGLSASEAEGVVARLDAVKARLTVLGQDPNNPVPAPPTT